VTADALKIVVLGHVDHGKSTLIGRVLLDTRSLPKERLAEVRKVARELGRDTELAYLTDQLKEERERNITIDTTQIFFKTRRRRYVIIDAPGHVEFIKNMLSGASAAEAAVLMIDAAEGLREQTRRHAYLARFIGMTRPIVAVNKMDLVGWDRGRFEAIRSEIEGFLAAAGARAEAVVPISAKEGGGVVRRAGEARWYRGPTLVEALDAHRPDLRAERPHLRMAVQDVFAADGRDWVLGRIASGTLRRRDPVEIFPGGRRAVVEAIRGPSGEVAKASSGDNVGLGLSSAEGARRGSVVTAPGDRPAAQGRFAANVFWLAEAPLRTGETVVLRCATQEVPCRAEALRDRMDSSTLAILEPDARELGANESAHVVFEPAAPVFFEPYEHIEEFGRFVLEKNLEPQGFGIFAGSAP
jgi:small GTP-binding protein